MITGNWKPTLLTDLYSMAQDKMHRQIKMPTKRSKIKVTRSSATF